MSVCASPTPEESSCSMHGVSAATAAVFLQPRRPGDPLLRLPASPQSFGDSELCRLNNQSCSCNTLRLGLGVLANSMPQTLSLQ